MAISSKGKGGYSWKSFRSSVRFRNLWLFLVFVVIATLFWFILALNDNVQDSCDVRLKINGVPDSVTFINIPPKGFHVTVRDKGSSLMRTTVFRRPTVSYDFKEVSAQGITRLTKSDILAGLRAYFGSSAQFTSVSVDSLRLKYVTGKGKKVPVIIDADLSTEAGCVISSPPVSLTPRVEVFAERSVLDTITRVYTKKIVKRNLGESQDFKAAILPVAGARVIPEEITVRVKVEPLVSKDIFAEVEAVGVPEGMNLILFPSKVKVNCFVPMSDFSDETRGVRVYVDYKEVGLLDDVHLPLHISELDSKVRNAKVETESVEYTLVKY